MFLFEYIKVNKKGRVKRDRGLEPLISFITDSVGLVNRYEISTFAIYEFWRA
jgi:hypothetical protein